MFNWKMLLMMAMPMLEAAGQGKIDEDANDTGRDDAIGQSLLFAVKILRAIVLNKPLPTGQVPDALK